MIATVDSPDITLMLLVIWQWYERLAFERCTDNKHTGSLKTVLYPYGVGEMCIEKRRKKYFIDTDEPYFHCNKATVPLDSYNNANRKYNNI